MMVDFKCIYRGSLHWNCFPRRNQRFQKTAYWTQYTAVWSNKGGPKRIHLQDRHPENSSERDSVQGSVSQPMQSDQEFRKPSTRLWWIYGQNWDISPHQENSHFVASQKWAHFMGYMLLACLTLAWVSTHQVDQFVSPSKGWMVLGMNILRDQAERKAPRHHLM